MRKAIILLVLLMFAYSVFVAADIEVLTQNSQPTIHVSYEEDVNLLNYSLFDINDNNLLDLDKIDEGAETDFGGDLIYFFEFMPAQALTNGLYGFRIIASDDVGNKLDTNKSFEVDILFAQIFLINPENNVSQENTFDIIIEVINAIEGVDIEACGYSQNTLRSFAWVTQSQSRMFEKLSDTQFIEADYNIQFEDSPVDIYVYCNNSEGVTNDNDPQMFRILVDKTPPIVEAKADPNPVIDELKVELIVKSQIDSANIARNNKKDLINCHYSEFDNREFDNMEFDFYSTDDVFNEINIELLTDVTEPSIRDENNYTFFVQCKNRAGLLSEKRIITIEVDLAKGSAIIDKGPEGYVKTKNPTLFVDTNRHGDCIFEETGTAVWDNLISFDGKHHEIILSNLKEDDYEYTVYCENFQPIGNARLTTIWFTVDYTKPTQPVIYPEPACSDDTLGATFVSSDSTGKIDKFQYRITDGDSTILSWRNTTAKNDNATVERKYLDLEVGEQYYFEVIAYDEAGNPSEMQVKAITVLNKTADECKEHEPPEIKIYFVKRNTEVSIRIVCIDDSGCDEIRYEYIPDGEIQDCTYTNYNSIYESQFTQYVGGLLCYKAADNVGNIATGEEYIDFVNPECNIRDPKINPGEDEVCNDDIDNDCDGDVDCADNQCTYDNLCKCTPGAWAPCGPTQGVCAEDVGTKTCNDEWRWEECVDPAKPSEYENCGNGLDDDCDGYTDCNDEECQNDYTYCRCSYPSYVKCGSNVGVCEYGEKSCDFDQTWSICIGGVTPQSQTEYDCSNYEDDDCDGLTDCDDSDCALSDNCLDCTIDDIEICGDTDLGQCEYGQKFCNLGVWGSCEGVVTPEAEICEDNIDNDCDGIVDNCEIGDEIYENEDLDSDGDGIPDYWEKQYGLNPYDPSDASEDSDNDGLTNLEEYRIGSDPTNPDTDGDSFSDGAERTSGTDPTNPDSYPLDTDGDGMGDEWERRYFGDLSENGEGDFDEDGLSNYEEYIHNTNPTVEDSDWDGLLDEKEVNEHGTNPSLKDTDGDGYTDGEEVLKGSDPLDSRSKPKAEIDIPVEFEDEKSHLLGIILLITGLLMIIGGASYLAYKKYKVPKGTTRPQLFGSQQQPSAQSKQMPQKDKGAIKQETMKITTDQSKLITLRQKLALQKAVLQKKSQEKQEQKSRVMDAFEEKKETPIKYLKALPEITVPDDKVKAASKKEIEARRIMFDMIRKPREKRKLDAKVKGDSLKQVGKLSKDEVPSHIQEKLDMLAKEKDSFTKTDSKESSLDEIDDLIEKNLKKKKK